MDSPICLVSETLPTYAKVALSQCFSVVSMPADSTISIPVSSHPDMIFCKIGDRLLLPQEYYNANASLIDRIANAAECDIVLSSAPRGSVYPSDVGMNVAVGDGFIICRPESTALEILDVSTQLGYEIIPVKQGYAGCSCIVTDKAVLTSDIGIHRVLTEHGIDSWYVDKSGIALPGYDVGFIGGCGGFFDGVLYFFGRLDSVECGADVRQFAKTYGYEVRELSGEILTDYGGIKIFKSPLDKTQKK